MGEGGGPAIQLKAGESAEIRIGPNRTVNVVRTADLRDGFLRRLPSPLAHRPSPPLYRLTDLGTLGGRVSHASNINSRGQVVGDAELPGGVRHAFLYDHGRMTDLDPGSRLTSYAFGINDVGQVVGGVDSNKSEQPFIFSNGRMNRIMQDVAGRSGAYAVNNAGVVVGVLDRSERHPCLPL